MPVPGGRFVLPRQSGSAHDYLCVGIRKNVAPGIVRSLDVKRAHDADLKKPGGTDGMTPTTNGEKAVDVSIVLEFWDDPGDPVWSEQTAAAISVFLDALFPEGKAPTPRDVVHPKLALHRIRSLFFLEWDGPKEIGHAHWQITLKAANYKPPSPVARSATSTPKASLPVAPGNVLVPPRGAEFGPPLPPGWKPPKSPDASKPRP